MECGLLLGNITNTTFQIPFSETLIFSENNN